MADVKAPFLDTNLVSGPVYTLVNGQLIGGFVSEDIAGLLHGAESSEIVPVHQLLGPLAYAEGNVERVINLNIFNMHKDVLSALAGMTSSTVGGATRIAHAHRPGLKTARNIEFVLQRSDGGYYMDRFKGVIDIGAITVPDRGAASMPIAIKPLINAASGNFGKGFDEFAPVAGALAVSSAVKSSDDTTTIVDASGVAVSEGINVTFGKPVFPEQLDSDHIILATDAAPTVAIACTITFFYTSGDANWQWSNIAKIVITPDADLAAATAHTLTIPINMQALDGNFLSAIYTASFTTA